MFTASTNRCLSAFSLVSATALTPVLAVSCGDSGGEGGHEDAAAACVACGTPEASAPGKPAVCTTGDNGAGCAFPVCADGPLGAVLGPSLGAVTDQSVRVWARVPDDVTMQVRVWEEGSDALRDVPGPALTAESDYTGVVEVDGLAPDHTYRYAVLAKRANGALCSVSPHETHVHTLPAVGDTGRYRFTVSADIDYADLSVFDRMAAHAPDFGIFLGDNIYADALPPTLSAYRERYRSTVARTGLRNYLGNVPIYATWDDHEITNDSYPTLDVPRGKVARQAFDEYLGVLNPPFRFQDGFTFTIDAANTGFYMFDTRSYRAPNEAPDGPQKSMLGTVQRADFVEWLKDDVATLHFVLTSVPFSPYATTGHDSWNGYTTERADLLAEIGTLTRGRSMIITGDQHWSGVFATPSQPGGVTLYEVMPTPVAQFNRPVPELLTPDVLASDDDFRVYAVIDVDTTREDPEIVYTLCDANAPCDPGNEPAPTTGVDVQPPHDNVPYTIRFVVAAGGLVPMK